VHAGCVKAGCQAGECECIRISLPLNLVGDLDILSASMWYRNPALWFDNRTPGMRLPGHRVVSLSLTLSITRQALDLLSLFTQKIWTPKLLGEAENQRKTDCKRPTKESLAVKNLKTINNSK
jgi:hypothetical protein